MFGHAVGFQEIGCDHWRNHPRHGKAHQNRGNNGQAKILKELPRNPGHQANWQKHCDNRKCGRNHGKPDFISGINRSLIGGFAHPHMPDDIFNFHNGIIDQHPGHKTKGKQ